MERITAKVFFDLIWPKKLTTNETLELRLRDRRQDIMKREFAESVPELLKKAEKHSRHYDVYFGIATRFGTNGGTKMDCYRVKTWWADLDNRKIEDCTFDLQPNILVKSGTGVHAYWLIKSTHIVRGEGQKWVPVEEINRGIAHRVNSDPNTCDITRILRVPGTFNHKHSPPIKVEAYLLGEEPYSFEQMRAAGFYKETVNGSSPDADLSGGKRIKLPPDLKAKLARVSVKPQDDPSKDDFAILCEMTKHIKADCDLYATFMASARGHDAEVRKNGNLDGYMKRTIAKVRSAKANELEEVTIVEKEEEFESVNWRDYFRTVGQLDTRPLEFVVSKLVPEEGVTGIGGLSGHGKTWVMLSMAKAIHSGTDWLDYFPTKKYPVLYIIPECGDRSFHRRATLLRIPNSKGFLIRTMSMGSTLSLSECVMKDAVKGRVVFLDTLTRFVEGRNEQTAQDMAKQSETIRGLLTCGAEAVIFAHHSPKFSRNDEDMTLENVFRGSGDIGANLDSALALRMIDTDKVRIQIENVKARDYTPPHPMQVEARPWIDRQGDLKLIKEPGEAKNLSEEKKKQADNEKAREIRELLRKNEKGMSANKLFFHIGGRKNDLYALMRMGEEKNWWRKEGENKKSTRYYALEKDTK